MKYNTLSQGTYENTRYKMLLQLEESGAEKLSPYVDSVGLPTIGAGFNLTDDFVLSRVYITLGLGLSNVEFNALSADGKIAERAYVQRIEDVVDATYFDAGDTSTLQNQLNIVMSERSADPLIPYAVNPTFIFNDAGEVRATFDGIMQDRYEKITSNWLVDVVGITGDIQYSTERLALLSLAYNSRTSGITKFPTTLGGKLKYALQSDNRAEAWFEIRYNTNAERSGGVARRRYIESEMFGLYDKNVDAGNMTDKQAKDAYRMFANHRADTIYGNNGMIAYDNNFSGNLSNASTEANLIGLDGIGTLKQELNPAYTYLINTYAADTGISIDWRDVTIAREGGAILTGNSRTGVLRAQSADTTGTGTEVNDLMIGGSGIDVLLGEGGDDVLIGGKGNDILDGGASGHDSLKGGAGRDTGNPDHFSHNYMSRAA